VKTYVKEAILQLEEGNQGPKIEQLPRLPVFEDVQYPSKETKEEVLARGALEDLATLDLDPVWIRDLEYPGEAHMIYHENQVPQLLCPDAVLKQPRPTIGARASSLP